MSSVCVHGLGYIGLPTAAVLANYDHDVVGYDANPDVVETLQNGDVHVDEPGLRAFVTQALESGRLTIADEIVPAKYHIICVPTPFDEETKEADLGYIESAGENLVTELREGDSVILESTVPPGTTETLLQPILEESGLTAGTDFALAHCPETVLPGNIITELKENNRIIGGVNGISTETVVRLYESFVEGEIRTTSDPTTAEFVKLIQNTFRDTNIALANEIAKVAKDYDVDSREAIDMANQHPRVEVHYPGPGVGGHCLPIDPWFLDANSDELDLIKTARHINDGMAGYIVNILTDQLGALGEKKVAILGVAYKGGVDDTRNSPGLNLARTIQSAQKSQTPPRATDGGDMPDISMHDPRVTDQTLQLEPLDETLRNADGVVVTANHQEYAELDPAEVDCPADIIVDAHDVLNRAAWNSAGYKVHTI